MSGEGKCIAAQADHAAEIVLDVDTDDLVEPVAHPLRCRRATAVRIVAVRPAVDEIIRVHIEDDLGGVVC